MQPGQTFVVKQTVTTTTHDHVDAQRMGEVIDELDTYLCCGLCCYSCGFAATCRNCFGIASETTCCCLEHACCLKPGLSCLWCGCGEGKIQLGLGCCSCALLAPSTCCKFSRQICCVIEHCAFPCGDEMPCTVAICGLAFVPKCGCCVRLNEFTEEQHVLIHQPLPVGVVPPGPHGAYVPPKDNF
mmetsp:Transcript_35469/g.113289  ORF Transcript_35469/g.113289 Transcript_35469/m.113289 type:complete len:185 (-) Transcript_35469:214-768(-)